jgi:hypothetical protein
MFQQRGRRMKKPLRQLMSTSGRRRAVCLLLTESNFARPRKPEFTKIGDILQSSTTVNWNFKAHVVSCGYAPYKCARHTIK